MVTSDPAAIEYALSRSQFSAVALPWEKTYALLSVSRVFGAGGRRTAEPIPFDVLDALARDAVRADARAHEPPSWWDDVEVCGEIAGQERSRNRQPVSWEASSRSDRRIVYEAGDAVARDLAERIAALSAADTARSPEARAFARAIPRLSRTSRVHGEATAEGMGRDAFEQSLRNGDDFAYIVSLPRLAPDPCREASELIKRAPWIAPGGARSGDGGLSLVDVVIPLIDTRSHLIVKNGAANFLIEGYGDVVIMPALEGRGRAR